MRTGIEALTEALAQHASEIRSRHNTGGRPIRIYHLYPCGDAFSVQTVNYHGTEITVSAISIQQAYAVAYKDSWINPSDTHPVGIVSIYRRTTGTTLWCGCRGHHVIDGQVRHGAGIRALREAINAHHCEDTDR